MGRDTLTRHDRVIAEEHFVDDQAHDTLSPKTFSGSAARRSRARSAESASARRRYVAWSRVRAVLDNAHPLALS